MSESKGNQNILLVGKPNSGKTTLFNLLTGLNQKVGNYSGVTVQRKSGKFGNKELIDIPGLKSLKAVSPEEKIAQDEILSGVKKGHRIIFVANGMQLADHLFLFSEIADLICSMILVINFKDDLDKNNIQVNKNKLASKLGCPVFIVNSRNGDGIAELKKAVDDEAFDHTNTFCRNMYDEFDDDKVNNSYKKYLANFDGAKESIQHDDYVKREKLIHQIVEFSTSNTHAHQHLNMSKTWDKYLLHPIYGLIIFLVVLYLVFQSVFTLSGIPMDLIDESMSALSSWTSNSIGIPWLSSLVSDALIQGVAGVIIFIPQIAILFFMLGILEHTGYLSRISYISDNFLRKFGLSGKSIIPLMSSWACAIPAIMSTRVIDDPKERLAVIMASPLMTCSARLPVYTILIAVLIPPGSEWDGFQGLLLLGLYMIGVIATLLLALFYSRKSKAQVNPFWSLELPVYRFPNWKNIYINVYQKTKSFVIEAGKVILGISILLWILASSSPKSDSFIVNKYNQHLEQESEFQMSKEAFDLEYSYLGYIGKGIEPMIKPLGYDWKIGIALLSSFAAREVFVGSLSTIYSIGSEEEQTIIDRLAREKNNETGTPRFNMPTIISLLLFYIFAMQCMSTLAVVKNETSSWKFAFLQFLIMFIMAYVFAFAAFQLLN